MKSASQQQIGILKEEWVTLNLKYNYSVVEVSGKVQEKVKNAIENMTGLEVADVNIKVAGVEMENQE